MAKKPVTSRRGRFFKLAGMTASVAGQYAGQRARRLFRSENDEGAQSESYTRMADQIADTLGERAFLYPSGGHGGNLDYAPVAERYLAFLQGGAQ